MKIKNMLIVFIMSSSIISCNRSSELNMQQKEKGKFKMITTLAHLAFGHLCLAKPIPFKQSNFSWSLFYNRNNSNDNEFGKYEQYCISQENFDEWHNWQHCPNEDWLDTLKSDLIANINGVSSICDVEKKIVKVNKILTRYLNKNINDPYEILPYLLPLNSPITEYNNQTIDILKQLLNSNTEFSKEVIIGAFYTLGEIGKNSDTYSIISAYKKFSSINASMDILETAAETLGKLGGNEINEFLLYTLEENYEIKNKFKNKHLIKALRKIGNGKSLPVLKGFLKLLYSKNKPADLIQETQDAITKISNKNIIEKF